MPTLDGFTTEGKSAGEIEDELSNAGADTKAPFTASNPKYTNPNAKKLDKFANGKDFSFNQKKHNYSKSTLDSNFTKKQLKRWAKKIYDIGLDTNNTKDTMLDNFINERDKL